MLMLMEMTQRHTEGLLQIEQALPAAQRAASIYAVSDDYDGPPLFVRRLLQEQEYHQHQQHG